MSTPEKGRLSITRKPGQAVRIGDDVVVTVVSSRSNEVRLTFEAPLTVKIQRTELEEEPSDTAT